MNEFMLIFRHEDGGKAASPKQIQQWMTMTKKWLDEIATKEQLVSPGNGLSFDDARVVGHGNTVTNGPFGDIKETIGGYIVVKAQSADEAAELAKKSPVLLAPGNTIEVRKIAYYKE
ncbi:YciI family protein [Marinoscillum pacificum]|uniref:YciI family protein n=1 Tax=Marinoscillum pacificum TaxID=392723 RepID=UPI0021588127|nr:YciI family protein [Marinoscillum pacificum]